MTNKPISEVIAEIKAAAEKATIGRIGDRLDGSIKYQCRGHSGSVVLVTDHKNDEYGFIGPNYENDEAFFLACKPENIIALIDHIAALEQQLAAERARVQWPNEEASSAMYDIFYQSRKRSSGNIEIGRSDGRALARWLTVVLGLRPHHEEEE